MNNLWSTLVLINNYGNKFGRQLAIVTSIIITKLSNSLKILQLYKQNLRDKVLFPLKLIICIYNDIITQLKVNINFVC